MSMQQNLLEAETNRLNSLEVNFKLYCTERKGFIGIVVSKKHQTVENLARIESAGYAEGEQCNLKGKMIFWISIEDLKEKLKGEFLE